MVNTVSVKLYEFVKRELKLSNTKAKEFVEIFDEAVSYEVKENSSEYRSIMKEDLLKLEMNLRGEIKDTKNDMLKWFVGIFITLALMIIGLYIKK